MPQTILIGNDVELKPAARKHDTNKWLAVVTLRTATYSDEMIGDNFLPTEEAAYASANVMMAELLKPVLEKGKTVIATKNGKAMKVIQKVS